MAQSPEMRASDVDRDRVAAVLREHTAQGRLTVEEFNERLEDVYQSKTYGELARVTADLPDVDLRARAAELPGPASPARKGMHQGLRAAWVSWASAVAVTSVIWLLTGADYFWPMWVAGPWGALLLVSTLFGSAPQQHGKDK
ncbi:DUF1707 domain-containing protein [Nonomuraea sp. NPDC046570]|uniref:DUF1707 SHOCT-like domain-containing protein n=1 Tax=Nonomuraea sp. NPDC046570 TaxID=3155255 RepID=UPI00341170EA